MIRLVGVPMVIGGFRDANNRVTRGVEVCHHMRDIVALCLAAMCAMRLDLAETSGERKLLLAREELFRKYDDMMREKGGPDCVLQFG